jgi:hypothetical protein
MTPKDFNAAIENAASRFARYCIDFTPCGAAERVYPVLHTIAFIYGTDIRFVTGNFECVLLDIDESIYDAWCDANANE